MKKKTYIVLCLLLIGGVFCFTPVRVSALSSLSILDCEDTLLGSVNDEDSVAWLVQQILDLIKVVGPILVVVLSSIDFLQVILKGDDDAMGKATKKLITRLILAILLFLVPVLVEWLLDIFGITTSGICGLN